MLDRLIGRGQLILTIGEILHQRCRLVKSDQRHLSAFRQALNHRMHERSDRVRDEARINDEHYVEEVSGRLGAFHREAQTAVRHRKVGRCESLDRFAGLLVENRHRQLGAKQHRRRQKQNPQIGSSTHRQRSVFGALYHGGLAVTVPRRLARTAD